MHNAQLQVRPSKSSLSAQDLWGLGVVSSYSRVLRPIPLRFQSRLFSLQGSFWAKAASDKMIKLQKAEGTSNIKGSAFGQNTTTASDKTQQLRQETYTPLCLLVNLLYVPG